ncbi:MAG: DUF5104 domain-containing protein [Clostridiales Family XIII bacterium]|jgi:hypothetical protein|nr:DUF5104 domain-containing protein [Clostridiales Family XIII bacterium]
MRKALAARAAVLLVVALCLGLSACNWNEVSYSISDDNYRSNKLGMILNALNKEDRDTIKGLFSKSAARQIGEGAIDEGITYLLEVFHGPTTSRQGEEQDEVSIVKDGKKQIKATVKFRVTTQDGAYYVQFVDCIADEFNAANIGVSQLVIMREEDKKRLGLPDEAFVGIFRADIVEEAVARHDATSDSALKRYKSVVEYLQNGEAEALEAVFSKSAVEAAGEEALADGIEKAVRQLEGGIETSYIVNPGDPATYIADGKVRMVFTISSYFTVQGVQYDLSYQDCVVDEISPGNVGIDKLVIVRSSDAAEYPDLDEDFSGIFCP